MPFGANLILPPGTAIGVAYLLPTSSHIRRRGRWCLSSWLIDRIVITGFFLAPTAVDPEIAQPYSGGVTTSSLAGIGFSFIRTRLAICTEDWLQRGQVGVGEAVGGSRWKKP